MMTWKEAVATGCRRLRRRAWDDGMWLEKDSDGQWRFFQSYNGGPVYTGGHFNYLKDRNDWEIRLTGCDDPAAGCRYCGDALMPGVIDLCENCACSYMDLKRACEEISR